MSDLCSTVPGGFWDCRPRASRTVNVGLGRVAGSHDRLMIGERRSHTDCSLNGHNDSRCHCGVARELHGHRTGSVLRSKRHRLRFSATCLRHRPMSWKEGGWAYQTCPRPASPMDAIRDIRSTHRRLTCGLGIGPRSCGTRSGTQVRLAVDIEQAKTTVGQGQTKVSRLLQSIGLGQWNNPVNRRGNAAT